MKLRHRSSYFNFSNKNTCEKKSFSFPLFYSISSFYCFYYPTMKFTTIAFLATAVSVSAFSVQTPNRVSSTSLNANIRGPTEKAAELRFGWDGTTALGGAVEVAKPSRMLDDIRAAGEEIPNECEVFNANLEMSGDEVMFEEVIEVGHKEYHGKENVIITSLSSYHIFLSLHLHFP